MISLAYKEDKAVQVEAKLQELGLELPAPMKVPPGFNIPFSWTRVRGNRVYISGQGPLESDGTYSGPFGKVPSEVSLEEAQWSARKAALSMLSSLKRELEDLDRVTAWLVINGMVNADPGYPQTTLAINGFSDLILELYGPKVGQHARTAVGMVALPANSPVVVAVEVEFA